MPEGKRRGTTAILACCAAIRSSRLLAVMQPRRLSLTGNYWHMTSNRAPLIAMIVLLMVAAAYWPVINGGFVWDDQIDFVKYDWLTAGSAWKHYIFRDFHGWTNYFRPLVVALFTLQLRSFGVEPGPMHAVSLCMHLANTLLVGVLAMRYGAANGHSGKRKIVIAALSMMLFGLHPSQIETVAWIAAQFDLFATFFMLTGLLASIHFKNQLARSITVSASFFLAACSKESAAAFPVVLIICDWAIQSKQNRLPLSFVSFLRGNAGTYAAVMLAGLVYLVFRHWALGVLIAPALEDSQPLLGRLQTAGFVYFRYLLMLVMPSLSPGPLHPFDPARFNQMTLPYLALLAAALAIVIASLWRALKYKSPAACILLAMTATLLPVLHLVPHTTDHELYAMRYLMACLAILCSMIPLLEWRLPNSVSASALSRPVLALIVLAWITTSILTIRITIPMWSSSVALWKWGLEVDPTSPRAANALLIAYLDRSRTVEARQLADWIMDTRIPCGNCMLNAAELALQNNDQATFRRAVGEARKLEPQIMKNFYFRARYRALIGVTPDAANNRGSQTAPSPTPAGTSPPASN